MEFYIVKEVPLEIPVEPQMVGHLELIHVQLQAGEHARMSKPMPICLEPVVPVMEPVDVNFCDCLAESLAVTAIVDTEFKRSCSFDTNVTLPSIIVDMALPTTTSNDDKGKVRIVEANAKFGRFGIFQMLEQVCGVENVKLNAKLKIVGFNKVLDFEMKDSTIKRMERLCLVDYGCELEQLDFSNEMRGAWQQDEKTFHGQLTVTVTLNDDALSKVYMQKVSNRKLQDKNKLVLEEDICSDFEIVAANGARVKCHKIYLSLSSDVFKSMFENEMKKAITNSIEMPDMSEDGVRALLAFVYNWDLKEASKSCDIAFELYQGGHRYGIIALEQAMRSLICAKPEMWFSVDMAVKLVLFAKKLNQDKWSNTLLKKSIHVLKWYTKTFPGKLQESVEYRQLFEQNYKEAMQVGEMFLSFA